MEVVRSLGCGKMVYQNDERIAGSAGTVGIFRIAASGRELLGSVYHAWKYTGSRQSGASGSAGIVGYDGKGHYELNHAVGRRTL